MATTLGGSTLADPDHARQGYVRNVEDVGAFLTMADGSVVFDYVDSLYVFHLSWNAITEAERNTILTKYLVKTAQAFSPPDSAGSYNVIVIPGSWKDDYTEDGDGTARYYCELSLREAY